ncbi:MAG: OmpA family protein [bacterium]
MKRRPLMDRKTLTCALGLFVFALATPMATPAQVSGPHLIVGPYAGWTIWDDALNPKDQVVYGGRAGVMFNSYLGVEGTIGFLPGKTESGPWPYVRTAPGVQVDEEIRHIGVDAIIKLGNGTIAPYLVGGWQQLQFENDDPSWGHRTEHGFEAGAGLMITMAPRIALRLDARDVFFEFDDFPPDVPEGLNHNMFLTVGLSMALGGSTTTADADGDGVGDKKDLCPGTPLGALVDAKGCPIDGDKDGVFDGLDECASTPAGAKVDTKGCPKDSDKDGVWDGIDMCEATPAGAKVDAKGCPSDADKDGVWDGLDQCANTPTGAKVDAKGCTVDSDGDGIVDGLDRCPNTPAGAKVDKDGCPIEISEKEIELLDKGVITVRDIHFETAKWDILPDSYSILNEIGGILVQWPQLRIEIGGHADARGGDDYNLDLSQKRSQSVLDYLVSKFPSIGGGQFTAKGYGESVPVAPNTTIEGMARNRRVEFKVLNTEELTKEKERRRMLQKNE